MLWKLLSFIIYLYLQFVFYSSKLTGRVKFENKQAGDRLIEENLRTGKPFILAFWHGRLAMMPRLSTVRNKNYVMISEHKDGQLIADVCAYFGLPSIRGSSNRSKHHAKGAKDRGGSRALAAARSTLKRGDNIAITPDGPKGPRMHLQQGVVALAALSGAPVIPASFSASWGKVINSWDRFLLPYPFSRILILIGEPIEFSKEDSEVAGKKLEQALNLLTHRADSECGRAPVEPA